MSLPVDHENILQENILPEEKSNIVERDLPLDKLLKLSKSFKIDVDNNLNKFKKETISMMNEISNTNCTVVPVNSNGTNKYCENQSHEKCEEDSNMVFRKDNCETFNNLEQELISGQNHSLEIQNNEDEFKPHQYNEEFCVPSMQDNNGKINYLKKIFEIENKYQYWMDKYNELHDKYLQLEFKCMRIEKENCNYQMEIARIQMIENENLRLNQLIDKSNHVRKELESALESCHEVVDKYHNDLEIARNKVKEAIEVVEKTYSEKDRLVKDLNNSKEELIKLETSLKNLMQESGKKVNIEVEKIKTMYKNKLREANDKFEFLLKEKQIECNKNQQVSRECEIINKKYISLNQKYIKELDLNSKNEALFDQKIKEYEVTLADLTANVKTLRETNMKLQKRCPEDNFEEKNSQINELRKHIEAHKQIVDMWRKGMHDIIEGFKHKIIQLKQHCDKLNKKNIKLKRIINNSKLNSLIFKKNKKLQKSKSCTKNINLSDNLPMSIST